MRIRKKLVRFIIAMTLAIVLTVGQLSGAGATLNVQASVSEDYLPTIITDYVHINEFSNSISDGYYYIKLDERGQLTVKALRPEDNRPFTLDFEPYIQVLDNKCPWGKYTKEITSVNWDLRITTIPSNAFDGAKFVTFPISEYVTDIKNGAFVGCRNLKSITLGKNLKTIENYAFSNSGLTSINIPASVTSIGDKAFSNCDDLKTITISSENKTYSSKNANMIYENASDKIIYVCDKSTKVPQGTKIIGESVFSQSPITTLNLPCSLKTIEPYAFYGSSLTSVKIPEGVETIGSSAFEGCKNLKSVYLPTNIKLENNAFAYNDKLTDIYYTGTEAAWGITSANSNYATNSDGSTRNVKMHYNYKYTTHNWDNGVITTEPTTTKEGVKTYTCKDCKETRTESIPKLEDNTKPTQPDTPTEPTTPKDTHGPNTGNGAYPFIKTINGSTETALFSFDGKTEAVNGLSYDKNSNTLTMKNFTGEMLSVNEMGDDFVIKVEGTNTLSKLWVWGYGYCGSVKLTGSGTLNIKNDNGTGIELSAENSKSQLYIDKNVKINISCGSNAIHVSESTHDTPIKFASGVTPSNGKITTASSYLPAMDGFTYACSKAGSSYSFWYPYGNEKDGYLINVYDSSFALVESIPWDGLSIPTKAVENAGYTVSYSTTKVTYADIAVKKLTLKTTSIAKASLQSVKGAKKAVTVTAKKVSGAKGYQIRYATNKKMTGAKSIVSTGTSKKITGLKAKTKYYVQVRAYKLDAKGKKVYGAWSAQKAVTTK